MTDDTLRDRLHRALDRGTDPFQDEGLAGALARDPEAAADARALTRIDQELRGLGRLQRSDAARKAFAARVSRRLAGGPLRLEGDIAGDLAVPTFDDDDAVAAPSPPAADRAASPAPGPRQPPAGAGAFSLERLGELETQPTEPPHVSTRQRRPPPGDDRISIPKVGRVLPPPPALTLEPPTPETPPSEAPGPSGSGRWALVAAALFAVLVVGGGAAFALLGGFEGDEPELAMNDVPGDGPGPLAEDDVAPENTQAAAAEGDEGTDGEASGGGAGAAADADGSDGTEADADGEGEDGAGGGAEASSEGDRASGDEDDEGGRSARRRRRESGSGASSSRTRRERPPREEAAPSGPLPDKPTRAQVLQSLQSVEPRVRGCRETRGGIAQVRITVASSGRVRNAVVQGVFAGTPEGSCVARAVRRARFPKFKDESFSVTYPFRL